MYLSIRRTTSTGGADAVDRVLRLGSARIFAIEFESQRKKRKGALWPSFVDGESLIHTAGALSLLSATSDHCNAVVSHKRSSTLDRDERCYLLNDNEMVILFGWQLSFGSLLIIGTRSGEATGERAATVQRCAMASPLPERRIDSIGRVF